MTMKKQYLAAVLALFVAGTAQVYAQSTALGFTRIDRNPRTSALAGAGAASNGNGAYGAFKNAAALPSLQGMGEVFAGLQLWEMSNEVDKTTNLMAGTGFHFGKFGVALGGVYQKGVPLGTFIPSDYLVSLGVAFRPIEKLSIGVNARYAGQNFSQEAKVGGFSADVTLFSQITDNLSVMGGVACFGPQVKGSSASYSLPTHLDLAVAWKQPLGQMHRIELMLDGEYDLSQSLAAAGGAEYVFDDLLFLRVGYRLAGEKAVIPSHLALGMGVQFQGFRADISYLTASPILGNTLNIGIAFRF